MNIQALTPKINVSDIPLEQLAGNKNISDPEKVAEVSRQFEAVLLRQIFQAARKPLLCSEPKSDATTSGIYNDMINNQLADCVSRSGTFGLATSLQGQLAHQTLPNVQPDNPPKLTPLTATPAKHSSK